MAPAKSPVPEGYRTVTPILTFEECSAALDWYVKGLGAEIISKSPGPDGRIMHSAFKIGDSMLMAHDTMMDGKGPKGFGGSPVALWIYVADCDALFNKAIAAGATQIRPVEDQFWGDRCGTLKDPNGLAWTIATRKEDLTGAELGQRAEVFFKQMAEMMKK
ncbi:MAG TPA: VOC family protein [Candidatus Eisenbacteria bacterium]